MDDKINDVVFDDEFRVCPICGFKDGSHTMLKQDKEKVKYLISDINWRDQPKK
jgi:hypothetical protein